MLYIFIILYCFFCILLYDTNNRKEKNYKHYWIIIFILTFLSSIQYRMGADILTYMSEFEYYESNFSINYLFGFSSRRPLWVLLNMVCRSFFGSFVVMKTIIAIFVNVVIARFLFKRAKYKYVALLLYFIVLYFHFNFNVLRNSVAICFFIMSYEYLERNKYLPYVILNVIGFGFHESIAVPALISVLLKYVNINNVKETTLYIFVVLGLIIPMLPNSIRDFFQMVAIYYDVGIVGERAVHYINKDNYSDFALSLYGYIEWIIKLAFFMWVFVNYRKAKEKKDKNLLSPLLLFVLFTILNNAIPILYRIAEFYSLFYIICITDVLSTPKLNKIYLNRTVIVVLLVFYIHTFFLFIGNKEIYQYYPYTSIIDMEKVPIREQMYGDKEYIEYIK